MKVILLVNHVYAIPTINFLASKQMLQAIVMPDVVQPYNQQVETLAKANSIPYKRFAKKELNSAFKEWLIKQAPDIVLGYTFSYKIPEDLFSIPVFGFFNVHYSLLPGYMGPLPVFWQIKNGERESAGITIHKMDKEFDTGPVFRQQVVPISPGETQGLYSAKLSALTVTLIADFVDKISSDSPLQPASDSKKSYYSRPEPNDFTINWQNDGAEEIENLTNACNSEIGGAITTLNGQIIKIVEVTKANVTGVEPIPAPGTIVHSDINNGLYVACKGNEYLRINVLQMPEGIFSGNKLATMGLQAGAIFG